MRMDWLASQSSRGACPQLSRAALALKNGWPLPGYRGELSNDPRSDDGLAVTWDGAVVLTPTLRVTELRGAGADW